MRKTSFSFLFLTLALSFQLEANESQSIVNQLRESLRAGNSIKSACEAQVLHDLGWRFEVQKGVPNSLQVKSGDPCARSSWSEAYQAGDLRILLDSNMAQASASFQNQSQKLLNSIPSTCAFKFRLHLAGLEATSKLQDNKNYTFGSGPGANFIKINPRLWSPDPRNGNRGCFKCVTSPAQGIESFYSQACQTECAGGLQVAQLAALYEVYGAEDFNRVFRSDEISVAPWEEIMKNTQNPFWTEQDRKNRLNDETGEILGRTGRGAFIGVTGYVEKVIPNDNLLDSPADQGQNFLLIDISNEAAKALGRGDIKKINEKVESLWKNHAEKMQGLKATFDELKRNRNPQAQQAKTNMQLFRKQFEDLLTKEHPILSDTIVFVHPIGTQSLAYHLARQLEVNPRMPFKVRFYESNINSSTYFRYVGAAVEKCELQYKNGFPPSTILKDVPVFRVFPKITHLVVIKDQQVTNFTVKNARNLERTIQETLKGRSLVYALDQEGRIYRGDASTLTLEETSESKRGGLRLNSISYLLNRPLEQGGEGALYALDAKGQILYLDPRGTGWKTSSRVLSRPVVQVGNDRNQNFIVKDDRGDFYVWKEQRNIQNLLEGQWEKIPGGINPIATLQELP